MPIFLTKGGVVIIQFWGQYDGISSILNKQTSARKRKSTILSSYHYNLVQYTYSLMAYCGNDSSGEQFDTSPGSDPDDEYESAVGATFFVASKTWSSEQRTILQARLDDWKQTKSSKSRNLIIQGALKELGALPGALPIDEMKLVSHN